MIDPVMIVIIAAFGAFVGAQAAIWFIRDRNHDELMAFCRTVVDKNEKQLAMLVKQVEIIVAQDRELTRLRAKEAP